MLGKKGYSNVPPMGIKGGKLRKFAMKGSASPDQMMDGLLYSINTQGGLADKKTSIGSLEKK